MWYLSRNPRGLPGAVDEEAAAVQAQVPGPAARAAGPGGRGARGRVPERRHEPVLLLARQRRRARAEVLRRQARLAFTLHRARTVNCATSTPA